MRRLLLLASAVVFVDTAFYAAITPLLPRYVEELGITKSAAGLLSASYPAGTFLGALPGGWLAAHAGVRPTTVLGLSIMAASSVAFAFGESIVVLDVARFIQGIGGAMTWAGALGWLIGEAPSERRGELIGSAMGAAIVGALFGPVLGAAAAALGPEPVFSGVGVVALGLIAWTLRTPARRPAAPPRLGDAAGGGPRPQRPARGVADDRARLAVRDDRRARPAADGRARGRRRGDRRLLPRRRRARGDRRPGRGADLRPPRPPRARAGRARRRHRRDGAAALAERRLAARRADRARRAGDRDPVVAGDRDALRRRRAPRDRAGDRVRARERRVGVRSDRRLGRQRAARRRDQRPRSLPAARRGLGS